MQIIESFRDTLNLSMMYNQQTGNMGTALNNYQLRPVIKRSVVFLKVPNDVTFNIVSHDERRHWTVPKGISVAFCNVLMVIRGPTLNILHQFLWIISTTLMSPLIGLNPLPRTVRPYTSGPEPDSCEIP